MKLLIITPFMYSNKSSNGGGVYCAQQIKELSKHFELYFVTFENNEESIQYIKKFTSKIFIVPIPKTFFKKLWGYIGAIVNFRPSIRPHSHEFSLLINKVVESYKPDAAFIQFPNMAGCIKHLKHIPCFMDVQDVFSLSKKRRVPIETSIVEKLKSYAMYRAWLNYEKKWYPKYQKLFTLSETDTNALQNIGLGEKAITTPAAIEIPLNASKRPMTEKKITLGFLGWFAHHPNTDAARTLLNDIFPKILKENKNINLILAGKDLPKELEVLCKNINITYIGFVENLEDFFNQTDIFIAPLNYGAGIKIKVLQALAYGCPVITTSIGFEGINAIPDKEIIVCPIDDMANIVLGLSKNHKKIYNLGSSGRTFSINNLSWKHKGDFIYKIIKNFSKDNKNNLF